MNKQRKRFTQSQRDQAVDLCLSGEKTAKQIALELQTDVQNIYRWKTLREEQDKGLRIEQLISEGNTKAMAQKLLEKDLEIEAYQKKVAELTVINDLLKKLQTSSCSQPESELTGLIRTSKKVGSKKKARKIMKLSTSSYYYDPKVTRAEKEEADADIRAQIEQLRVTFPKAGYRHLLHHLKRGGVDIGETKLRRILGESGLFIKPRKKFVSTTESKHDELVYPNLIKEMTIDSINQVWAGDITYIRINNGFVFLAVLLDLYSRKVIGWSISKKIDGQLTLNALKIAITTAKPPRGVIHHNNRGVPYLYRDYKKLLAKYGLNSSCSAKGNPCDNAWSESFMKTIKHEEILLRKYETYLDVVENVPYFIEEVYNDLPSV